MSIAKLKKYIQAPNIADLLDDDELSQIGGRVIEDYEADESSREGRVDRWNKATELAKQTVEAKNTPFSNAANIKFPLITSAIIQFNARCYPAIVNGQNVARSQIFGSDEEGGKQAKADRATKYFNWQLLEEDPGWEEDTDKLTIQLPNFGIMFRKRWWSPEKQRQCSKLLTPLNLVVNAGVKSLEDAPTITEIFELYPNDIKERERRGLYLEYEYQGSDPEVSESIEPHTFLEQHRWEDLDDDGYMEPYIVTVHKETGRVVRIKARYMEADIEVNSRQEIGKITPKKYYVKYGFIPDPEGTFYDIGFCDLLYPLNNTINTHLNQVTDAATIQNAGGGFISSHLKIGKGPIKVKMNEYKTVKATGGSIRDGIVPFNHPGPSVVLFNLVVFLIETGKEIASIKDVLTGEAQNANASPTTTLAMIEQGLKVFSAIYKRIHRSLKAELKQLREINYLYLNPDTYSKVLDVRVSPEDFNAEDFDFVPVTDPTVVTDMQQMGRAQFLMQFINDPFFNQMEIRSRLLKAARIEDEDTLLVPPSDEPTIADQLALAEAERKKLETEIKAMEMRMKEKESEANIENKKSSTIKNLADAEAVEQGNQLGFYQQAGEALYEPTGVGDVEGATGNARVLPFSPEGSGGPQTGMGGGSVSGGINPGQLPEESGSLGTGADVNPDNELGL